MNLPGATGEEKADTQEMSCPLQGRSQQRGRYQGLSTAAFGRLASGGLVSASIKSPGIMHVCRDVPSCRDNRPCHPFGAI